MSRGWLIVFGKAPRAGLVKTRMSPPLSLEQSAVLYEAMLIDVLEASARFAERLDLEPILAFHPPDAAAELLARAPADYRLQAQRGTDLGKRMANAFAEGAAAGAERMLLRGSDSPALEYAHVESALSRLDAGDDVVLTPDQSGGYAMIGMRSSHPGVFDLPMSTECVLDRTIAIARGAGLRLTQTEASFDLDTVADLARLSRPSAATKSDLCPRTVESIAALPLDAVL